MYHFATLEAGFTATEGFRICVSYCKVIQAFCRLNSAFVFVECVFGCRRARIFAFRYCSPRADLVKNRIHCHSVIVNLVMKTVMGRISIYSLIALPPECSNKVNAAASRTP